MRQGAVSHTPRLDMSACLIAFIRAWPRSILHIVHARVFSTLFFVAALFTHQPYAGSSMRPAPGGVLLLLLD